MAKMKTFGYLNEKMKVHGPACSCRLGGGDCQRTSRDQDAAGDKGVVVREKYSNSS